MKKIISIIMLLLILTGCNKSNEKMQGGINEKYNKKLNISEKIEPIGLYNNYYIYMENKKSMNDTGDYDFWKYNVKTDKKAKLGSILNATTTSATYAFLNNKIYFSYGSVENNKEVNNQYEIDLDNNTMRIISKNQMFPPMIMYANINEEKYLQLQPEFYGTDDYIYHLRIGDCKGNVEEVIKAKTNPLPQKSRMITSMCAWENLIYTVEYEGKKDDYKRYICIYDENLKLISKENIKELDDFLLQKNNGGIAETLWEIKVFKNYYYFSTLSNRSLVLKKNGNFYERVNYEDTERLRLITSSKALFHQNNFLFYDMNAEKYIIFDSDTGKYRDFITDNCKGITGVTDGEKMVYINGENEIWCKSYN